MGKKQRRRGFVRSAKGGRAGGSSSSSTLVVAGGRAVARIHVHVAVLDRSIRFAASARLLKSSGGDDDGIDLRGIISTNDNPFGCAQCLQLLMLKSDLSSKVFSVDCCGKRICETCVEQKDRIADRFIIDLSGQIRCVMCKALQSYNLVRFLRDQAHLGRPYAQFEFATQVEIDGYPRNAIFWRERADAQGHPHAFICLAESIRNGEGCTRDLPCKNEIRAGKGASHRVCCTCE